MAEIAFIRVLHGSALTQPRSQVLVKPRDGSISAETTRRTGISEAMVEGAERIDAAVKQASGLLH